MSEEEIKTLKLSALLKHFSQNKRVDRKFCFILGSGASKQSGIPTGGELVLRWLEELKTLHGQSDVDKWLKENSIDINNPAPHYSKIYAKRFELDRKEGYYELEQMIVGKEPSCGYSVLAQVLAAAQHDIVISVNFDSLMEDAMFIYTKKRPLVCGHELLVEFVKPSQTRPLIAKIHRDILLAPKSNPDETCELEKGWERVLSDIFKTYTPIVIGYGGNDGSLMGFLEKISNIEGGIFWCYRDEDKIPDGRIQTLVKRQKGFFVPIEGFDEMMVQLNSCLGYQLLYDEITSIAKNRADSYRKQFENIQKSDLSVETSKALDKTIRTSKQDWWTVELKASKEKNPELRDKIYLEGLKLYPFNSDLLGSYATFLHGTRKEFDNAEKYYKKTLEIDPNSAIYNGNYAVFLKDVREDYDNAEKYFKKALELDPNHAVHIGNYAFFLKEIRKDYNNAEKYYKKSLELNPNNSVHSGNYAFFLKDVLKDYDNAEKYHKKALELDPNNANNYNIYAIFLKEIRKDYDNAEKYFKKSLELDPNNAVNNGNYAIFLEDIHGDYANAEKYYIKAIELNPNDANNMGNYAKLFIEIVNIDKAEEYINKAFDLNPTNKNLFVELWFYRFAIFPNQYKDAYDKILELIQSGARSLNWNLKKVIEVAEKRGHKQVDVLKKLDRIITEDAPISILDEKEK